MNVIYVKLIQNQKAYLCHSKYLIPGPMTSYLNARIIERSPISGDSNCSKKENLDSETLTQPPPYPIYSNYQWLTPGLFHAAISTGMFCTVSYKTAKWSLMMRRYGFRGERSYIINHYHHRKKQRTLKNGYLMCIQLWSPRNSIDRELRHAACATHNWPWSRVGHVRCRVCLLTEMQSWHSSHSRSL